MIGVIAPAAQRRVLRGFSTCSKLHGNSIGGTDYEVLICSGLHPADNSAPLVLSTDAKRGPSIPRWESSYARNSDVLLSFEEDRIPIYRTCSILPGPAGPFCEPKMEKAQGSVPPRRIASACASVLISCEVEYLLERGSRSSAHPNSRSADRASRELIVTHSTRCSKFRPSRPVISSSFV
jgi:hypothetical protein